MKTTPDDASTAYRPARTWTDFCYARLTKREHGSPRMRKDAFSRFLDERDLPHPHRLKEFASAEDIDLGSLPDSFVIKPSGLWSGKGVMLLHRISDTPLFYEAMKRAVLTEEDVKKHQLDIQNSSQSKLSFLVEERAIDESPENIIPLDYKIFSFFGETGFVLQVDRNHTPPRVCFFDGQFNAISEEKAYVPLRKRAQTLGQHQRPSCFLELLQMAKDITIELRASFLSVDCFATRSGPMFGELTPTPGGPWYGFMYRFSTEFDEELGERWRNACMRLGMKIPEVEFPYQIRFQNRVLRTVE